MALMMPTSAVAVAHVPFLQRKMTLYVHKTLTFSDEFGQSTRDLWSFSVLRSSGFSPVHKESRGPLRYHRLGQEVGDSETTTRWQPNCFARRPKDTAIVTQYTGRTDCPYEYIQLGYVGYNGKTFT